MDHVRMVLNSSQWAGHVSYRIPRQEQFIYPRSQEETLKTKRKQNKSQLTGKWPQFMAVWVINTTINENDICHFPSQENRAGNKISPQESPPSPAAHRGNLTQWATPGFHAHTLATHGYHPSGFLFYISDLQCLLKTLLFKNRNLNQDCVEAESKKRHQKVN